MSGDACCATCGTIACGASTTALADAGWLAVSHGYFYCPSCTGPTVGSVAQSIRELGEMLAVADQHPDHRERLVEVERLAGRVTAYVGTLHRLVLHEVATAMGVTVR